MGCGTCLIKNCVFSNARWKCGLDLLNFRLPRRNGCNGLSLVSNNATDSYYLVGRKEKGILEYIE